MALVRISHTMSVKLTHLWPRSPTGPYWFKRKVPKALVSAVGKTWIQFSLGTRDLRVASRLITDHVTEQDRQWAALLAGHSKLLNPAPGDVDAQANQLLRQHGIDPKDPAGAAEGARSALESVLDAHLPDYLREATEATPQELDRHLSPVHRVALQVLQGRKPFTLTKCMDDYIAARPSTEKDARLVFGYLLAYLGGDRDIRKVRRSDVNGFVAWLLQGGHGAAGRKVSTTTVGRYLVPLRAAYARAIKEEEFGVGNVFAGVEVPDHGADVTERESFTVDQYRHLYAALDQWSETKGLDPLRCVLTLVTETGARLAEVVGLAAADLDLAGAIPSMTIQAHPWRSLKTPGSARQVPLSPRAVEAAKVALGLRKGALELFPDHASKVDSVSATLVKWVRTREGLQGSKLGNHSLRHGMKDRLRAVECPDSIQDAVLGHVTPGVGASYGQGYPLSVIAEWVRKALSVV
ncbi:integrase [Paraburkholderia sp. GAS41]|uniref:DUF6538 domain-containing protein n=1 Tax=Paraburkholderia sp. GAS41 TaxID=3035134 RepID=UPI003D237B5E